MNNTARIVIVVALLAIVGVTIAMKQKNKADAAREMPVASQPAVVGESPKSVVASSAPAAEEARVSEPASASSGGAVEPQAARPPAVAQAAPASLPRLVDLGAGKCIPCKKMAPILEELKKDYAGRMNVEFIDVWLNPKAGEEYGVSVIPTQIFYDASGAERFRHVGFFSREDILAKWKELGIDVERRPVAKQ